MGREDVMEMRRKNIFMLCLILLLSAFAPVTQTEAKATPKLSMKSKTMTVGKTSTIKLKNAGRVKWKTSKKSVVSIVKTKKNTVRIKAKKKGKATITATYRKKKYKVRITVKDKKKSNAKDGKRQGEKENPKLNATNVVIYHFSEEWKEYLTVNPAHQTQFQFKVSGTKQEVEWWWLEGDDLYFNISDDGLLTAAFEPYYDDWKREAVVKAKLEDGMVLQAKATVYSEINFFLRDYLDAFVKTYITEDMTDYEKAEKAAWYLSSTTDYEAYQSDWMDLLLTGKGDCMASRVAVEYMCQHMGLKAYACGNMDYHGKTLLRADGKYYMIVTGYGGVRPRAYYIYEVGETELEKTLKDNRLVREMFE